MTVAFPGVQGPAGTGTQGMGVSTPMAADVAEATVGLASDWHIPKVGIFTMGLKSMMFAMGMLLTMTRLSGKTTNEDGAMPIEHCIIAPIHTHIAIVSYTYLIITFMSLILEILTD